MTRFVYKGNTWFDRGGSYAHGTDSGTFAFASTYGSVENIVGFRLVLTP